MKRYIKKLVITGLVVFFMMLSFCNLTAVSLAQEAEVKGDVSVTAIVPSKVIETSSHIESNTDEVLADFSQRIIITVTVHDKDEKPLEGIPVKLTSNRGEIDKIKAVTADGGTISFSRYFIPEARAATEDNVSRSDKDGKAYFEVLSSVPGEAIFTAVADGLVALPSIKINFLPLPFPKNVTISIAVPKFISPTGEIKLLSPADDQKSPGNEQKPAKTQEEKAVNLGVNIKIPLWVITIVLLSILMNIVLFALVISMIFKVRKTEKKEESILEKEEEEVLEKIKKKDV